jgi:hypothetical protein
LNLVFPFRSAQQVAQGAGVAAPYLLTYLDEDMLIGRASGTAGGVQVRVLLSLQSEASHVKCSSIVT